MNEHIKSLYKRLFTRSFQRLPKNYTIGIAIYESDHWAWQTVKEMIRIHNRLKQFATLTVKKDYEQYSKERCFGKYNLAYCPICNEFLNKKTTIKDKIAASINKKITGYDPMRIDIYTKSLEAIKSAGID